MARANLTDKLRQIRKRRLVAGFCRRCGKSRTWFLQRRPGPDGQEMTHIDAVLAVSGRPIVAARGSPGPVAERPGRSPGVSRQTIHTWETEPSRQERLDRACWLCASRVPVPVFCPLRSSVPT